jgi:hypothetical protein
MTTSTRQSPTEILRIKAAVRERDGYCCVECGTTNDEHVAEHGSILQVHRLEPGAPYSADGCVTLCKPCHGPKPRLPHGVRRRREGLVRLPVQVAELAERLAGSFGESVPDYLSKLLLPILENERRRAADALLAPITEAEPKKKRQAP